MKYKGQKLETPENGFLVIPRPGGDVVFEARMVRDYTEFDKIHQRKMSECQIAEGRGRKRSFLARAARPALFRLAKQ